MHRNSALSFPLFSYQWTAPAGRTENSFLYPVDLLSYPDFVASCKDVLLMLYLGGPHSNTTKCNRRVTARNHSDWIFSYAVSIIACYANQVRIELWRSKSVGPSGIRPSMSSGSGFVLGFRHSSIQYEQNAFKKQ